MARTSSSYSINLTGGLKHIASRDPRHQLIFAIESAAYRTTFTHLRRALRQTVKERWGAGWIHISDMALPCDRLLAAPLLGEPAPQRSPLMPVQRRIYDNGTYMHLRYQAYFHALRKPWEVQAPLLLYRWPLVGETDVAVQHPDVGNWLIELKSMNTYQWKQLNNPREEHVLQVGNYAGLRGAGWQGQIWYENKNDQEIKAFVVSTMEAQKLWEETWRRASRIGYDLLDGGVLPRMCRACPDVEYCESFRPTRAKLEKLNRERSRTYPSN